MRKITFRDIFFDASIFLNGDLPNFRSISSFNIGKIIAADGAANRMINENFSPDLIIGDMDSFTDIKERIEIIKDDDQNTNDFEKILIYLIKKGIKNILIFGLHGGILEHTLNNISVFLKYQQFFNSIVILDKDRYGIYIDETIQIALKQDEIISIIPTPHCNIKTDGLYWNLNNESLEIGAREGARNKCVEKNIKIWLNDGSYFLFFESRFPNVVEYEF